MRLLLPTLAFATILPAQAFADPPAVIDQTEVFFDALEKGDLDQLRGLMSNEIVNTLPFAASGDTSEKAYRVFRGIDQVMAYFEGAGQFIPQVRFVDPLITVSADQNTVIVETRGDMQLADGRSYENLYVWRLDFQEGQIVEITEYFNPVTAAIAFGRPVGPQN